MDEITKKLQSAYDTVAYETGAYRQSHPDRLAVVATLRGIPSPAVETCSVLEIGCAGGANLLPMAEQLPKARFLGIDLSARQIETASNIVHELQLTNIEFRCQDIREFPRDAGKFDYIIAHGVYSWVPPAVQQSVLEICRTHLAPEGMAFISYNTYPGWRAKEIAREMMLYHSRNFPDSAEAIALGRQIVQLVSEHTPDFGVYRQLMRQNNECIRQGSDSYLLHEYLPAVNDPKYFWRFIKEAQTNGLAYVGESRVEPDEWLRISKPIREVLGKMSTDPLEREQYLDFLVLRTFRNSVLCLAEAARTESPVASRIRGFYVAGNPQEMSAGMDVNGLPNSKFGDRNYQIVISDPRLIATLHRLRSAWPSSVPFADLVSEFSHPADADYQQNGMTEQLEREIELYYNLGLVELGLQPSMLISPAPDAYPRTTRYARWQASHETAITSLRHSSVKLGDALRQLTLLLDGTRDRKTLAVELLRRMEAGVGPAWPHKNRNELHQMIESALLFLNESSLLLNHPGQA